MRSSVADDITPPYVGVWIAGGIGNQLFQYATAYAYAVRAGARLLLDIDYYASSSDREYGLAKFGIDAEKWPWGTPYIDWRFSVNPMQWARRARMAAKVKRLGFSIMKERRFDFAPEILDGTLPCYLFGYWQSPRYFAAEAPMLRSAINLETAISPEKNELYRFLKQDNSVAMHVRRGDYAEQAGIDSFGLIGYQYYAYAADLFRKMFPGVHFHIFSDDYNVTHEMFGDWPDATVCPPGKQEVDLALIAACRHQVIANSTFSWWGAWLNDNPNKIVIAPKQWNAKKVLLSRYVLDLFPEQWLLL